MALAEPTVTKIIIYMYHTIKSALMSSQPSLAFKPSAVSMSSPTVVWSKLMKMATSSYKTNQHFPYFTHRLLTTSGCNRMLNIV